MTNELLGALTVLVTTNFVGVSFAPVPCTHPGCAEGHHSFLATERYVVVRDTWAEVVGTGENRRLHSDTNAWGSLSHPVAHPSVYHMHTQPGWAVMPGTRWPLDLPPLPPWEDTKGKSLQRWLDRKYSSTAIETVSPRRSNTAALPSDTNHYGVFYNVTTNYQFNGLMLEKRFTDRDSGVRVWEGDSSVYYTNPPTLYSVDRISNVSPANGAVRFTNPPTSHVLGHVAAKRAKQDEWILSYENGPVTEWTNIAGAKLRHDKSATNSIVMPIQRFQAIPATNALPRSRRFAQ